MEDGCPCGCQRCQAEKAGLAGQVEALKARVADLVRERHGHQSERRKAEGGEGEEGIEHAAPPGERRPRGQQPGSRGHGRRSYEQLPCREEVAEPGSEELVCGECGAGYERMGEDSSEQLDWEVVVRRVLTRRPWYRRTCSCPGSKAVVQAAPPAKVIPKGRLTAEFMAWLVVMKFELRLPGHRVLKMLAMMGVEMAPGSLCGVYLALGPLLAPLAEAIRARNRAAANLHMDETRWEVFFMREEEHSEKWYVWVMIGPDTTSYLIKPGRGANVVAAELGIDLKAKAPALADGRQLVLSTDCYSVYQSLGKRVEGVVNSWCWVHMRRYFVKARDIHSGTCGAWAGRWLERIGRLFKLHEQWLLAPTGSQAEADHHQALWALVAEMDKARKQEVGWRGLPKPARKVLGTLDREWQGLLTALQMEHRGLALENNVSERGLRGPVLGRKNSYGSGSVPAAKLTADIWAVFATVGQAGWNQLPHLQDYLGACAQAGGHAPSDLDRFLPWSAGEADRLRWAAIPDTS